MIGLWQSGSSAEIVYQVHDPLHIPMCTYKYKVVFNYAGKLSQNGVTGMYVANVRIQPDEVWVAPANSFDSTVTVSPQVLNVGSASAPVAGLTIVHRLHFHNWSRDEVREDTFVVKADGTVQKL